MILFILSFQDN